MPNFAEATAVTQLTTHTYSADFPDDWCIGSVPHGGFVTAVFLQVASKHFQTTLSSQNQPHTLALHLDFLRRTRTGPAHFTVTDTKLGRQTSVLSITLLQASHTVVISTITQSNLLTESGPSFTTSFALSPPPPPFTRSLPDPHWTLAPALPYATFRRASRHTSFHLPSLGQPSKSISDEWIRLASGERWTNASLGYVCDTWPMPIESFTNPSAAAATAKFWYPTVLLNLDFKKALPAEGVEWLFVRVAMKQVRNGRMDLEVTIMDAEGDLVALSHQIALVVGAERNVKERRDAKI